MIEFKKNSEDKPYIILRDLYIKALDNNQKNIEAITISSYNTREKEVNSRIVNLKYIENNQWIFFTNYNSPKSLEFTSHSQISCILYWNKINVQIRIKAHIKKLSKEKSDLHFISRDPKKNALAIASNQSKETISYDAVIENYEKTLRNSNLTVCPDYWGGFSFIPYYFEFWEGHESRINKREVFDKTDGVWKQLFLQP